MELSNTSKVFFPGAGLAGALDRAPRLGCQLTVKPGRRRRAFGLRPGLLGRGGVSSHGHPALDVGFKTEGMLPERHDRDATSRAGHGCRRAAPSAAAGRWTSPAGSSQGLAAMWNGLSLVAAVQLWPPAPGPDRPAPSLRAGRVACGGAVSDEWLATTVVSLDTARRLGHRGSEAAALTSLGGGPAGGAAVRGDDHRAPGRRGHLRGDRRPAPRGAARRDVVRWAGSHRPPSHSFGQAHPSPAQGAGPCVA